MHMCCDDRNDVNDLMDFFFFFSCWGKRGTHAFKILQSPNVKPKGAPFKRGLAPKTNSFSASVLFLTSLVVLCVAALCHSGAFTTFTLANKSHRHFVVRAPLPLKLFMHQGAKIATCCAQERHPITFLLTQNYSGNESEVVGARFYSGPHDFQSFTRGTSPVCVRAPCTIEFMGAAVSGQSRAEPCFASLLTSTFSSWNSDAR